MDNKLRQIVKQVAEAQNFDSIGNYKDAYVKYLQSTENVIHQLLDNAATTAEISCDANTKKMVSVGVMCIQRAEDLLNSKILIVSERQYSITSPTNQTPTSKPDHSAVVLPPSGYHGFSVSASPTSSGISLSLVESLSPVELAEKQNRQIMAAYRARMSGLSRRKATDMSLSLQRRLAENIAIGKAREKALAKKKQERRVRLEAEAAKRFATTTTVISKEELERRELYTKVLDFEHDNMWLLKWRQKLKDDPGDCVLIEKIVHLILRTTNHPLTQLLYTYQNKIYDVAQTLLKQWNSSHEMSEECQITDGHASRSDSSLLSSLSTNVADDVTRSVFSISTHPDDHGLLDKRDNSGQNEGQRNSSGKIHGITSGSTESGTDNVECSQFHCDNMTANRPLNELRHEPDRCDDNHSANRDSLSSVSLQEMDREAILHHLANVAADIQDYLEKLITMFIFVYESLDNATGRDCCYSCIAELFYKPVWSLILSLFRVVYKKEECQIHAVMHKYRNSSPVDLQIPRKFCLLPEDSLLMPEGYQPYQTAISELQTIVNTVSPLTKLECIVHVSRAICDCVEEFYTNNKNDIPNIGADDLLPMLSYVVIKTNLPQIYAECQALEELIHEGYLMGEEGYCLTSLETAMKYIMSL